MEDVSPRKKIRIVGNQRSECMAQVLPNFVLDANVTPSAVRKLATERITNLSKEIFCFMATTVKELYSVPGKQMRCKYPHYCPPIIFQVSFSKAKMWMEALGWHVEKDIMDTIHICDISNINETCM